MPCSLHMPTPPPAYDISDAKVQLPVLQTNIPPPPPYYEGVGQQQCGNAVQVGLLEGPTGKPRKTNRRHSPKKCSRRKYPNCQRNIKKSSKRKHFCFNKD